MSTILSLGRALNLPITAEGIEDDGTKDRLTNLGCSDGQGWLFGKAVSGDVVRATLGIEAEDEQPATKEAPAAQTPERRSQIRRAAGARRPR